MKYPTEAQEAKKFWDWSQWHPIAKHYLSHIENESKTSWANGKQKKAEGKRKGISDYFLAYPIKNKDGVYKGGLWIELKRASRSLSRLTQEQAEWMERMERIGYATKVSYGADEAIKAVEEYLR